MNSISLGQEPKEKTRLEWPWTSSKRLELVVLLAVLMTLFDLIFLEIRWNHGDDLHYVLLKSGTFSPSFLFLQFLSYIIFLLFLDIGITFSIYLAARIQSQFSRIDTYFVTLVVSMVLMASLVVWHMEEDINIADIVSIFILMITFGALFYLRFKKRTRVSSDNSSERSPAILISALVLLLMVLFFAQDLSSLWHSQLGSRKDAATQSPNVLMIVLDTVRADRVNGHGDNRVSTPNIDALANGGVVFSRAYAAAPWTLPSHASMFTGLLPSEHRADWGHGFLDKEHVTLAEILEARGFRTVAFSENPNVGAATGLDQGFREFYDTWRRPVIFRAAHKILQILNLGRDRREYASRTLGFAQRWVRNHRHDEAPFFVFINLMGAHLPRYPRADRSGMPWSRQDLRVIEPINLVPERFYLEQYKISKNDLINMEIIYDQEISYLDARIGQFISYLRRNELLDRVLIVVTSDHGELFGEHGYIEHQLCLFEGVLRVPLIIHYPQEYKPRIENRRVSTRRLFSTIIEETDTSISAAQVLQNYPMASLLRDTTDNRLLISEYSNGLEMLKRAISREAKNSDFSKFDRSLRSVITGDYKFIWYSTGESSLFNLERDPYEELNLAAERPEIARSMHRQLTDLTNFEGINDSAPRRPVVDAATRDALKALGYEQ